MAEMNIKPVASDDMTAGILAAIKRGESVQVVATLIDSMPDDDWLSDEADTWNINAGSDAGDGEIDDLDADVNNAA